MIQTFYARRDKLPDMNITHIVIDEVHNMLDDEFDDYE